MEVIWKPIKVLDISSDQYVEKYIEYQAILGKLIQKQI